MSLQLDITSPSGVVANYHKVVKVIDIRLSNKAEVIVNVYKDAESKMKAPLAVLGFVFGPTDLDDGPYFLAPADISPEGMNHIKAAYLALKTLAQYEGAQDV